MMARGLNKVMLIGNLGREPEMRYTPSGTAVTNATLAVGGFANGQETTEWFRLVLWEKNAENFAQYAHKGRQVYVEGRLASRKYTDRDGIERQVWEVVAYQFQLLGPATEAEDDDWGENRPVAHRPEAPKVAQPRTKAKPPTEEEEWEAGGFDDVPF